MPNPEYQRLLRCRRRRTAHPAARRRARTRDAIAALIADLDDAHLARRDPQPRWPRPRRCCARRYAQIDDTRPTVHHRLHHQGLRPADARTSAEPLVAADRRAVRGAGRRTGHGPRRSLARFDARQRRRRAVRGDARSACAAPTVPPSCPPAVPTDIGRTPCGTSTTQAALGRTLLDLSREAPDAARRVVTVSPDVSSTTNLAGWLNKVGVWSPTERRNWFDDDAETIMHWRERPTGQHMELGIAETNLVGLIGELGATWSRWGQPLLPDRRALRPVRRTRARTVVVRHLRRRSVDPGRHPVRGHAGRRRWCAPVDQDPVDRSRTARLCQLRTGVRRSTWSGRCWPASARLGRPDGSSSYLRLSTRPVDQRLAAVPADPAARERRRRQVVAGAYLLRRSAGSGGHPGRDGRDDHRNPRRGRPTR